MTADIQQSGPRGGDAYTRTLLDYYEEEVMGEAYFHGLAGHISGDGVAEKLHLLGEVERCAAEAVAPLLAKHGLEPRPRQDLLEAGAADIAAHKDWDWRSFVDYMVERYPGYVDDFEGLERLAPKADLPRLKVLTRHEIVAIEFAVKEAAGEADSTAPLTAYIEECAQMRQNGA